MSSIVAFQGAAHWANYAATKAWVQTFAEGLRAELRPHGVDVLSGAPGPVATGFSARADVRMGSASDPKDVARATLDALGRSGTVRPGARAKVLGWSMGTLPRAARVLMMGTLARQFTRHRSDRAREGA